MLPVIALYSYRQTLRRREGVVEEGLSYRFGNSKGI
jgi:hypothetical protein